MCESRTAMARSQGGDGAFGVLVVLDHDLMGSGGDQAGGRAGGWRLVLPLVDEQGAVQVHPHPSSALTVKLWVPAVKFWIFTQRIEKLSGPTPTPVGPPRPSRSQLPPRGVPPFAVPDSVWLAK
jgi:hypothetical protein